MNYYVTLLRCKQNVNKSTNYGLSRNAKSANKILFIHFYYLTAMATATKKIVSLPSPKIHIS